ncbi:MAG TPA: VWA domain-containing protein [Acidimicrobiales bacterium]|nr:VWA domain-containing protein [Acidimicrobiales bacterium]
MSDITFTHPERLWLLLAAALLTGAYVAVQLRRHRLARRFASPALLASVLPRRVGPWRHLVAVLFLAGVVASVLGAAQPTVPGEREREHATIVVAIDVSDSMAATDVRPDRLTAAKAAARDFIEDLPDSFDVALVTAGASPAVIVAATTDHGRAVAALDGLETSPGTALGVAIFTSLAAIRPARDGGAATGGESDGGEGEGERAARIVLLSDGVTTTGRPDDEAVAAASDAGVPVSTIAFGTDDARVVSQGILVEVPVDPTALEAIAEGTGGTFFEAASATELATIYDRVDAEVTVEATDRDVAEWFAGAALVLILVAVLASMMTTGRAALA